MLRLMYRRSDAKQRSRANNPKIVKRDGVYQQRAFQILNIPTRHGIVQFSTTTRGMDTQRIRKQRNGIRAVQVTMAWNSHSYDCASNVIAQETNEDIETYCSDTLKWSNDHWFQNICPLYRHGRVKIHRDKPTEGEFDQYQGTKYKKTEKYWEQRMPQGLTPKQQAIFRSL